jgi:hypothetical protein
MLSAIHDISDSDADRRVIPSATVSRSGYSKHLNRQDDTSLILGNCLSARAEMYYAVTKTNPTITLDAHDCYLLRMFD